MVKHYVIIDFQDVYGYSIIQSDLIPQKEIVFEGNYEDCSNFYNTKRKEFLQNESELNTLENKTYEG